MSKLYQKFPIIFSFAIILFSSSVLFAQGNLTGKVTDLQNNALPGVNLYLLKTTIGTASDFSGNYNIDAVPTGTYTLKASAVGYKSQEFSITINDGETTTLNITLAEDILNMDAVVVTGSRNPQKKIESSVAITTLTTKEIDQQAPRNTAELLTAIPGFYVESSGGEGGNNLFARGIPADGSYRYVQMQEDGLPLFEDGELMFANVDVLMRVDETIATLEGVRGGTGSIFASNSPGGIINFISKTGGNKLGGIIKTSVGDFGMYRMDVNYGGPLAEGWRFNIGGFYRYDEGIRRPGFPANVGGQFKGNITRLLDNGYVRFYVKYLNDRNIFYLPVPLQDKDNPTEIPGFDANFGTMTTFDANYLKAPTPDSRFFEQYLDQGMNPKLNAIGAELFFDLGDNWTIKNMSRYTNIDHQFNAIFSLDDPAFADKFATDMLPAGATDYRYSFVRSGDIISDPLSLNGNGLVAQTGWWSVHMDMRNFANHSQLTKSVKNNNITLGLYFSEYKAGSFWYWQNMLTEVADHPRLLNLEALDASGSRIAYITDEGFTRYGSTYLNDQINTTVGAAYLNDEWQATKQLRIDAGVRYEYQRSRGTVENTASFDLGDPMTLADDNVTYGTGKYRTFDLQWHEASFSVGGNYSFNPNVALYVRGGKGFRMPDDNQIFFQLDDISRIVVEDIWQAEGGIKYASPHLAVFAAAFYNKFENIPFGDEVILPDGTIVESLRFAGSRTFGLEVEAIFEYEGFGFTLRGTVQDPEYQDFKDNTGNRVRRIPQVYFTAMPSYSYKGFNIFGSVRFFGERFTDEANTGVLPSFAEFNAGISYIFNNRIKVSGNVANISNEIGLTEGNPRVDSQKDPRNFFFMARPILGRSFTFSLAYSL